MTNDPIVADVRKARREILASYGWDYGKMPADAMKRQHQSGRQVVSRGKQEPEPGVSRDIYEAVSRHSQRTLPRDADGPADGVPDRR